jgi:multisubunit Na+/H+ antiporter MnhB subunit
MSEPNLPEATPEPQSPPSSRTLLYGCLSVLLAVPFAVVNILLTAGLGIVAGPISAAVVVVVMFLLRRENKKPIVGALAVGAAIAFVLQGTCLLIIAKS